MLPKLGSQCIEIKGVLAFLIQHVLSTVLADSFWHLDELAAMRQILRHCAVPAFVLSVIGELLLNVLDDPHGRGSSIRQFMQCQHDQVIQSTWRFGSLREGPVVCACVELWSSSWTVVLGNIIKVTVSIPIWINWWSHDHLEAQNCYQ